MIPLEPVLQGLSPESATALALALRSPKVLSSWLWDPQDNTTCCYIAFQHAPNVPDTTLPASKCLLPTVNSTLDAFRPVTILCPAFSPLGETADGLRDALAVLGVSASIDLIIKDQTRSYHFSDSTVYIALGGYHIIGVQWQSHGLRRTTGCTSFSFS